MVPQRLHQVRFSIGETVLVIAVLAAACAWPVLSLPAIGGVLVFILRRGGFDLSRAITIVVTFEALFVIGGIVAFIGCSQIPSVYYAGFRSIERQLASQFDVTVVRSWKHEDVFLEDCGFTLQVRDCPLVRVDFRDGEDWQAQFRRIDEVAVCQGSDSVKLIRVERLAEMGVPVRNLPSLLAHLERVLAVADGMESDTAQSRPRGRWVVLRYPLGGGWE